MSSNYFQIKNSAPEDSLYMKRGKSMVFVNLVDIPAYREVIKLLDTKDAEVEQLNKQIEKLENAFRLMEQALVQRGITL